MNYFYTKIIAKCPWQTSNKVEVAIYYKHVKKTDPFRPLTFKAIAVNSDFVLKFCDPITRYTHKILNYIISNCF